MELVPLLRMLGALGVVLGLLSAALWAVRRFDIRLPGRIGRSPERRLEMIERLAIDPKRTLALIRRDGREHLILIAPEGSLVVDGAVNVPAVPAAFAPAPQVEPAPEPAAVQPSPAPMPSFEAQANQAAVRQQVSSVIQKLRERERRPDAVAHAIA